MALTLALLPLLAQVGPFHAPDTSASLPARRPPPAASRQASPAEAIPVARSARGRDCAASVEIDPEEALDTAMTWLADAKGADLAEAQLCLGLARSALEDWSEAGQAFVAARDAAGADRLMRARLGAMAGSAELAANEPARALAALDIAQADARGLAMPGLEAEIALDRSRALVALKRDGEAEAALAQARAAVPGSAEAWLLSATLARRTGNLAEAQARIVRAADLNPVDPQIGLEAGVIAVLAGRDSAARLSWQSVVTAAPESGAAEVARAYLAQLGPAPSAPSN